jgi:hypothetical protein
VQKQLGRCKTLSTSTVWSCLVSAMGVWQILLLDMPTCLEFVFGL